MESISRRKCYHLFSRLWCSEGGITISCNFLPLPFTPHKLRSQFITKVQLNAHITSLQRPQGMLGTCLPFCRTTLPSGSSVVWIGFMQVSANYMPGPGWHQEPFYPPAHSTAMDMVCDATTLFWLLVHPIPSLVLYYWALPCTCSRLWHWLWFQIPTQVGPFHMTDGSYLTCQSLSNLFYEMRIIQNLCVGE